MSAAIWAVGLLLASTSPLQKSIDQAVQLYDALDYEQAAAILSEAIKRNEGSIEVARAHLFLGLIALDEVDTGKSRDEFRRALLLNPVLELPPYASPKARFLFRQVRAELELRPPPPSGVPERSAASPADAMELPPSPTTGPSLVPAWAALGVGGGALVAAIVCGILANNAAGAVAVTPDYANAAALSTRAGNEGLAADILFGVAGAAGIAGGVLLGLGLVKQHSVQPSVVVTSSGAAATVAGHF